MSILGMPNKNWLIFFNTFDSIKIKYLQQVHERWLCELGHGRMLEQHELIHVVHNHNRLGRLGQRLPLIK